MSRPDLRDDRGQSLAEFSLVLPLLLLVVVGIVEFSNAWRIQQVITNVAREGARLAVLPTGDSATVWSAIHGGLTESGLDPERASLDLRLCDGACTGRSDTVRIDYDFEFAFVARLMAFTCQGSECSDPPGTITLSSATTMRNE